MLNMESSCDLADWGWQLAGTGFKGQMGSKTGIRSTARQIIQSKWVERKGRELNLVEMTF